jgi:hypothetical protein
MNFPLMVKIKQNFNTETIADIAGAIRSEITRFKLQHVIHRAKALP